MINTITITGATGNIGIKITEQLLKQGKHVKAIARNKEKLSKLESMGAEIFSGTLENQHFLEGIFKESDSVFVMLPPCYHLNNFKEVFSKIAVSFTKAIRATGISHIVMLSSVGAELSHGNGQISSLFEFESLLKNIPGTSVVALRSAFFMENHLGSIPMIKQAGMNGNIFDPDHSFGMISTKDIASAASKHLIEKKFAGFKVQYLLGARDYTFQEATSILGTAIGKPDMTYIKISYVDFCNSLINAGFSQSAAASLFEGLSALNEGLLTKGLIRDELNTTSTTLEEFAAEVFAPLYYAS